jgi:hypothetical protein
MDGIVHATSNEEVEQKEKWGSQCGDLKRASGFTDPYLPQKGEYERTICSIAFAFAPPKKERGDFW